MANRTQIVCLHEGKKGRSIDPVFINALIKGLNPPWLRPNKGSNLMRPVDCGGRKALIEKMPSELKACLNAGADTTLIVWADVDDDKETCDQFKEDFWTIDVRAYLEMFRREHGRSWDQKPWENKRRDESNKLGIAVVEYLFWAASGAKCGFESELFGGCLLP